MTEASIELPGLVAKLDKLVHHHGGLSLPQDKQHAFVYFVTITNRTDRTVILLGRKWVIDHCDGTSLVVEGDRIVGECPRLEPGESFSYNSYHVTAMDAVVRGCYHGLDDLGRKIFVRLPSFPMHIPTPTL